jgi:DNA-binding MarR family transcriptional regulator
MSPRPARRGRNGGPLKGGAIDFDRYAFYLIAHADHRYSQAMAAALARHRLSRPKWRALGALGQRDGATIGEVAEITLLKRSTLSRVVARLEREGLVRRRPRAADQRNVEVHITAAGRRALAAIMIVTAGQYRRAVAGIARQDVERLCAVLRRIIANLSPPPA